MKPYGQRRSDASCCAGHNKSSKRRGGHKKAKKRARKLHKDLCGQLNGGPCSTCFYQSIRG